MGDQVRCTVRFGDEESEGNALLESTTLIFRGAFRLSIPFKDVTAITAGATGDPDDGWLTVTFPGGVAAFRVGARAPRWLKAITRPKPVIDKLGVKPGMRVALVGLDDAAFLDQLSERAEVVTGSVPGSLPGGCDLIFLAASERADLSKVPDLVGHLQPAGALWVLRPKGGSRDIGELDVLEAGRSAGLVDTKVVAFSPSLSAARFAIPVARRAAVGT